MNGSFIKRGEFAWVQDVRANYVCIRNGDLAATVFSPGWGPWLIIMHYEHGPMILRGETHQNHQDAMSRVEEFLRGSAVPAFPGLLSPEAYAEAFIGYTESRD